MFKFKQFEVKQENSAMKVCTDSCLFGALITLNGAASALDIGAGTGLLSLMVAQKEQKLNVHAVEIDKGAAGDALENIQNSPFRNQIKLFCSSIQDFADTESYDLIFSNPPFYENQLKSFDENKNIAHHSSQLGFKELLNEINKRLKPNGRFWVLLPPREMDALLKESEAYLFKLHQIFRIKHNENKPVFRCVAEFSKTETDQFTETEILIYEKGEYSSIFTRLLKDYYLIF